MKRLNLTLVLAIAVAITVAANPGAGATGPLTSAGLTAYGVRLQGIARAYRERRQPAIVLGPLTSAGLRAYGLGLQGIAHAYEEGALVVAASGRCAAPAKTVALAHGIQVSG